jgi:hypothetical protein
MESEGSLPHLQKPAISPYSESYQSSPCPHPSSWRSVLILSSHFLLGLPSGLIPSGFPTKILYAPLLSPVCATCSAYLIKLQEFFKILRIFTFDLLIIHQFLYHLSSFLLYHFPDSRLKEAENCELALQTFAILKPSARLHSR